MKPTDFQNHVLTIPETWNVLLAGGRGGGKSVAIQLLVLRHCEKYGERARPLLIRETYKSASELEDALHMLFTKVYGKFEHNRQEHVFRLPNGAQVEIGQLERSSDYSKYQGRSFTQLVVDEFGVIKEPKWVTMLKSNLRAEEGIPLQEIRAANPGGLQHAYLHHRYIAKSLPDRPFEVDGETWCWMPSTLRDNPHLNRKDYEKKLRAAAGSDEALAKAWIDGDWNIARGAMFADVLDEKIHRIDIQPDNERFSILDYSRFISMDWGSARPSVVYLCLRSTGEGRVPVPRGSLILLDEVHTAVSLEDLNTGQEWAPGKLAEAIHDMTELWGLRNVPPGIGDDYAGLDESLLQVFQREGIYLQMPTKGKGSRVSGWSKMRDLFFNAKTRNGKPGMWVNTRCKYFWATLPFIPRDPDRPEDIISNGPDHGADAARYAVLHNSNSVTFGSYLL